QITEDEAMANTTTPGDLKLMLKGMVRSSGTGGTASHTKAELDEIRPDTGPPPEDAPADAAPKPAPVAAGPAPGSGTVTRAPGPPRPAGPAGPGQLRAPLRPTGRATPAPAPPGEGGAKPKINRGFDFQK